MKALSEDIRKIILQVRPELLEISQEESIKKMNPSTWSKNEILGHLIDSSSNNFQRFVRAALNAAQNFPTYDQNQWVNVQQYNQMDWNDLVELFTAMNLHLSRILCFLPESVWDNPVNIGKENLVSLQFVANDYIRHLKHHLEKILNHEL